VPTLSTVIALLGELVDDMWSGTLEVELHNGNIVQIHQTAKPDGVATFRPANLETR
jgi:hypothetical protein